MRRFKIHSQPQNRSASSGDLAHASQLPSLPNSQTTLPHEVDDQARTTSYSAERAYRLPALPRLRMRFRYTVESHGLGYSHIKIRLGLFGIGLRAWFLPIPVNPRQVELIAAMSVPTRLGPLAPLVRRIGHQIYAKEVARDLDAQNNEAYLDRTALDKVDSPLASYKRYAPQFYRRDQQRDDG